MSPKAKRIVMKNAQTKILIQTRVFQKERESVSCKSSNSSSNSSNSSERITLDTSCHARPQEMIVTVSLGNWRARRRRRLGRRLAKTHPSPSHLRRMDRAKKEGRSEPKQPSIKSSLLSQS